MIVEGVLELRHITAPNFVHALVLVDEEGFAVEPASIEVLQRNVLTVEELESSDPAVDTGWRRIADLDSAPGAGFVHQADRQGGTWSDMFARLDHAIELLLKAGWAIVDHDRQGSSVGDSVTYTIQRGETYTQFEMYEDGELMLWPLDENWSSEQGVWISGVEQVTDEILANALDEVT